MGAAKIAKIAAAAKGPRELARRLGLFGDPFEAIYGEEMTGMGKKERAEFVERGERADMIHGICTGRVNVATLSGQEKQVSSASAGGSLAAAVCSLALCYWGREPAKRKVREAWIDAIAARAKQMLVKRERQ